MPLMRVKRSVAFALVTFAQLPFSNIRCHAQAALFMEEPYGFFGILNPTGHTAIYFERICAETPVRLRRCAPGEMGAVISRYQGIAGYDWVAIPLTPYLYAVEEACQVPSHVDRETVVRMRRRYHEAYLLSLGEKLSPGNFVRGGWDQLIGVAYERRIYAFPFETSQEQDDALIDRMNEESNRSHFNLLYNNCADFARASMEFNFPGTFRRSVFPDAGMTTPKQIAYKLVRYAREHPETRFAAFEIPQIPGYRRSSRSNKSIAASLITTVYAVPITILNPYLAGGLFMDYFVRGRYHPMPKDPQFVGPDTLLALTYPARSKQNPDSANVQAPSAAVTGPAEKSPSSSADSDLKEMMASYE